jgi:hypothetical protein
LIGIREFITDPDHAGANRTPAVERETPMKIVCSIRVLFRLAIFCLALGLALGGAFLS